MKIILLIVIVLLAAGVLYAADYGWYVVTYSGQAVAGPFSLLNDCTEMAKIMQQRYSNISSVCQYR